MRGRLQVAVDAPDVVVAQQFRARFVRQPFDVDDRRRAVPEALDVGDREAAGQHDQAVIRSRRRGGEAAQERAQALVLELARLRTRPVLQRLDAVEHEQRAPRHQRLGDRLALGGRAGRLDFHAELGQRPVEKLVGRGRALLRALAVERPAEHAIGAAIAVGLQARQPFVDQRRLARAALGDEREDVGLFVAPGFVEALQAPRRARPAARRRSRAGR